MQQNRAMKYRFAKHAVSQCKTYSFTTQNIGFRSLNYAASQHPAIHPVTTSKFVGISSNPSREPKSTEC